MKEKNDGNIRIDGRRIQRIRLRVRIKTLSSFNKKSCELLLHITFCVSFQKNLHHQNIEHSRREKFSKIASSVKLLHARVLDQSANISSSSKNNNNRTHQTRRAFEKTTSERKQERSRFFYVCFFFFCRSSKKSNEKLLLFVVSVAR